MNKKLYPCQIPGCTNESSIRSKVKSGEHKGLSACPSCRYKYYAPAFEKAIKPIPKFTVKNQHKRRLEREGLPKFFGDAIEELQKYPVCENCGVQMKIWSHPVSRVAHILKKARYKSVMTHPLNRVFLCVGDDNPKNGHSCHFIFDNNINKRPQMPVFSVVMKKYREFNSVVVETGNEKSILDEFL